MAFQILLNFMIAFLWMFLNNDWTASGFIIGYVLGILVLFGLRRFFDGRLYLGKGWAIIKLAVLLLRELVVSSYIVVKAVLRPNLDIRPAILMYTTELKSDWEVAVLITLLCLTPGSVVLEVSKDNRTLYIHAMDIKDAEQFRDNIRNTFERAILEVSRS
ncbi:monovalent cation/H+ antiporter subunit E [Paenibacillus sp. FSL R7-0273]|uniref:Na+/H+ antiporter subunit E n=1 Tax=Paenibacillus sp. FSL R7-0273 TaxID=1536772 RepID=UPI0004F699B0|nr:Na+/H+ antiporter subunit E [Paenibacillus sp. FSL R7-0273]AIQ46957.1 monovalent cation/H+ antiporter subunit E [Paenibacillus sp. FSL R7-0273]OMF97284.1 Na+/H+ antiporter subunit E [Paenibacillus sp. FSL R7-0273]